MGEAMEVEARRLEDLSALFKLAAALPAAYVRLANVVLSDPRFQCAPGASGHHHAFRGGLMQHTKEVVQNLYRLAGYHPELPHFNELLLAAIWHDYHKIHEYRIEEDGAITKLDYLKRIGHVVGGYAEFYLEAKSEGLSDDAIHVVGHIMLAHHGRQEWGSPVEPNTPEAFLIHAADMMSARAI